MTFTIDSPADALKTGQAKLWIVLIGVQHYQDPRFASLPYSTIDCQGLADALSTATEAFPEKTVFLHCESATAPTFEAVRSSLQTLANQAQAEDTVLIYFCGHSALESRFQQVVLCLADTQQDNLLKTGLSMMSLLGFLGQCAAKHQILWLDTGHELPTLEQTRFDDSTPQLIEMLRQRSIQHPGFFSLLAFSLSGKNRLQRSWKSSEFGHGVFTYFLIKGLRGEAADAEGMIDVEKLYQYVHDQTVQYVEQSNQEKSITETVLRAQTPRKITRSNERIILGIQAATVTGSDENAEASEENESLNNLDQRSHSEPISDALSEAELLAETSRKQHLEEAQRQREEQRKQKEEAQRQQQEILRRQRLAEAAERKQREEILRQQRLEEETQRRQQEEILRRQREEQRQQQEETLRQQRLEEEAQRRQQEEALRRQREAQRQQQEETLRQQRLEEEAQRKQREEMLRQQRLEAEAQRKQQEETLRQQRLEEAAQRQQREAERKQQAEILRQQRLEAEAQRQQQAAILRQQRLAEAAQRKQQLQQETQRRREAQAQRRRQRLEERSQRRRQQIQDVTATIAQFNRSTSTLATQQSLQAIRSLRQTASKLTGFVGHQQRSMATTASQKLTGVAAQIGRSSSTLADFSQTQRQNPKTRKQIVRIVGGLGLTAGAIALVAAYHHRSVQLQSIQALSRESETLLASNQSQAAIVAALKAGSQFQQLDRPWNFLPEQTRIQTATTLQQALLTAPVASTNSKAVIAAVSPDGQWIATANEDASIALWQLNQTTPKTIFKGHTDRITQLQFSADGKRLASASDDKTAKLWDVEKGILIKTLAGHTDRVTAVSFRSDGSVLATGSADRSVKLWTIPSGRLVETLKGNEATIRVIRFNSDDSILATGSDDNTIRLWYPDSPKPFVMGRTGNSGGVTEMIFSPDGKTIASATNETISLWKMSDAKPDREANPERTLSGSRVLAISFNPTGNVLASASQDGTVKLWDVQNGTIIKTLPESQNTKIQTVAFNTEGNELIGVSDRAQITVWNLNLTSLIQQGCDRIRQSPDFSTVCK